MLRLVQLAAEEIGSGRELPDGFRAAHDPLAPAFLLRRDGGKPGDREHPDLRKRRGGDFSLCVVHAIDCHLHVGLAGSQPDFTNQHIRHREGVGAGDGQGHRFFRTERVEFDTPLALGVGGGGLAPTADADGDFLARIRPAPDGNRGLALQDHVVRKERGQPDGGGGVGADKQRAG